MAEYIPGVCNIGPAEIANRRKIGLTWMAVSIGIAALLFYFRTPEWTRLFIFLPATIAFSGLYQAKAHFCAGYGMSGLYNVANSLGKSDTVTQAEFRKKDKAKAQQIFILSLLSAAFVAIGLYFI